MSLFLFTDFAIIVELAAFDAQQPSFISHRVFSSSQFNCLLALQLASHYPLTLTTTTNLRLFSVDLTNSPASD